MGDKAGVISAVLAAATALAAVGGWAWQQTSGPEAEPAAGQSTATTTAAGPATATTPATAAPAGTAPPAAGTGTPLDGISRIGGEVTALPEDVSAADYSRPVAVECPSNNTGDQSRTLTYDLDRKFRTFTATVSAWAKAGDGDAIEVRVFTKIRQPDDTFETREAGATQGAVNKPGQALSAKVSGVDQLLVEVGCHKPGGVVILDRALLGG